MASHDRHVARKRKRPPYREVRQRIGSPATNLAAYSSPSRPAIQRKGGSVSHPNKPILTGRPTASRGPDDDFHWPGRSERRPDFSDLYRRPRRLGLCHSGGAPAGRSATGAWLLLICSFLHCREPCERDTDQRDRCRETRGRWRRWLAEPRVPSRDVAQCHGRRHHRSGRHLQCRLLAGHG